MVGAVAVARVFEGAATNNNATCSASSSGAATIISDRTGGAAIGQFCNFESRSVGNGRSTAVAVVCIAEFHGPAVSGVTDCYVGDSGIVRVLIDRALKIHGAAGESSKRGVLGRISAAGPQQNIATEN